MKFKFPRRSRVKESRITKNLVYTAHPLALGTKLGEYNIEKVVTQTQSGYTYVANGGCTILQEYFPRPIAIRDIDGKSILLQDEAVNSTYEEGLSKFLLLARILSQIEHPGRVTHYQEENDTAWYAVDFIPRASVGDLYRAKKRIPEESLRGILADTLTYLDATHQHDIFHLELGPDQIILSAEQELVPCGFNVCRTLHQDLREKPAAYYFAPEHFHTAGRIGPWSDLYGLGAILYQGLDPQIPPTAARRQDSLEKGHPDPMIAATKLGQGYYSEEFLEIVDSLLGFSTGDRPNNVRVVLEQITPQNLSSGAKKLDTSISRGPSYDFRNSVGQTNLRDSSLSPDMQGAEYRENTISDNDPSGSVATSNHDGQLMMDALNQISGHHETSDRVADALERASQILEPAEPSRRFVNMRSPNSKEPRFLATALTRNAVLNEPRQNKTSEWIELLRPRIFHPNINRHNHSLQGAHEQLNSSKEPVTVEYKKVTFFQHIWTHKPVLWFILFGVIAVAGMSTWLRLQSIPIAEPTRIEILSIQLRNSDIDNQPESISGPELSAQHTDSIDFLIQRGKLYEREGAWFGDIGNDAYTMYQAVLDLNPTNKVAVDSIANLVSRSLEKIISDLEQNKQDSANSLLAALSQRGLASDQISQLKMRIQVSEELGKTSPTSETLNEDTLKKETAIRRDKINKLLDRASRAFENGRLIAPSGQNALTLYRAALDLDRNNQRARNGINSIFDRYLQQARIALSQDRLTEAAENLSRASIVNRNDLVVLDLKQQLEKRRQLLVKNEKIRADLVRKNENARRLALEQTKLNLNSGISAYYRGNYFEAYNLLKPLADSGFTRAQTRVAAMLLEGRGVPPSRALATEWLLTALSAVQLAAARGEAWAQSDYGDYFADGIILAQDFKQAVVWYRRSAEQGYSPAQANLGLMHMHGSGVPPDWNEAIEWFRTAAAKGNYAAQENLRLLEINPQNSGS